MVWVVSRLALSSWVGKVVLLNLINYLCNKVGMVTSFSKMGIGGSRGMVSLYGGIVVEF